MELDPSKEKNSFTRREALKALGFSASLLAASPSLGQETPVAPGSEDSTVFTATTKPKESPLFHVDDVRVEASEGKMAFRIEGLKGSIALLEDTGIRSEVEARSGEFVSPLFLYLLGEPLPRVMITFESVGPEDPNSRMRLEVTLADKDGKELVTFTRTCEDTRVARKRAVKAQLGGAGFGPGGNVENFRLEHGLTEKVHVVEISWERLKAEP